MATGYAVTTLADLTAIAAVDREDKLAIRVSDERCWYQFRTDITEGIIPDDTPATGRWQRDTRERRNIIITTASLADGDHEQTTFISSPAFYLIYVQTDNPARIRIYTDITSRADDLSRAAPTLLQDAIDFDAGDAGLLFELRTTATKLSRAISPMPLIATIPSTDEVPITITNLSGSTNTIQLTLTVLEIE